MINRRSFLRFLVLAPATAVATPPAAGPSAVCSQQSAARVAFMTLNEVRALEGFVPLHAIDTELIASRQVPVEEIASLITRMRAPLAAGDP
jgi:hypothetical protein